jgi:hypothetical protein
MDANQAREATCAACGSHVVVPFFDGGNQPLATLAWPNSVEEALAIRRLPLDYVRCVGCSHVFNAAFDYKNVPYAAKPTLMFNRGAIWAEFIRGIIERLSATLPKDALVIELGHGDGAFLSALAQSRTDIRCLGFDPHGAEERGSRVELRRALVQPEAVPALGADLFVARHVLEHLASPLGLLQRVAFAAATAGRSQRIYVEVPCIDRAIQSGRTTDFFYEHCSQFTTRSFLTMLERAPGVIEEHGHGYDKEVIFAVANIGALAQAAVALEAGAFHESSLSARDTIRAQLATLHQSGKKVAVWGGTGKSGAFLTRYGMDRERFPTVVDSDATKTGTFVSGTGQEIRDPLYLSQHPVDVILVPPQWRARDILLEMRTKNIRCGSVLIEHEGKLIDFERDAHPYAKG